MIVEGLTKEQRERYLNYPPEEKSIDELENEKPMPVIRKEDNSSFLSDIDPEDLDLD